jgi:hypothetical protein
MGSPAVLGCVSSNLRAELGDRYGARDVKDTARLVGFLSKQAYSVFGPKVMPRYWLIHT